MRGNALVLAVLVLLAITSVGIMAVQRTNMDLMSAGNLVRATQAYGAGEAGLSHGMALMGESTLQFLNSMHEANMNAGSTNGIIEVNRSSTSTATEAEYLPVVADNVGDVQPGERIRQSVAYLVDGFWLGEVKGMYGYDVDGSGCMQVFDFNTLGGIPTQEVEDVRNDLGTGTLDRMDTVVVRVRSRALSGPVPCQLLN